MSARLSELLDRFGWSCAAIAASASVSHSFASADAVRRLRLPTKTLPTKKRTEKAEDKPAAEAEPAAKAEPAKEATATKPAEPAKEAKPAEPAKEAKPAATATAKPAEPAKAPEPKRNKVRLAQFVLKSSLPESLGQSGPFGEMQLDLRETISRIDKAADDRTIAGAVLDIQNPIDRPRQDLRAARRDPAVPRQGQEDVRPGRIGDAGRLPGRVRLRRDRDARDAA